VTKCRADVIAGAQNANQCLRMDVGRAKRIADARETFVELPCAYARGGAASGTLGGDPPRAAGREFGASVR
jgi:hypothetical protein